MNNIKSTPNFSGMKKKRSAMREKAKELGFKSIHSAVIAGHGEALAKAYIDQAKAGAVGFSFLISFALLIEEIKS